MVGRLVCVLALGVALAGCATRPGPEALNAMAAAPNSKPVRILVATTRERASPDANVFTDGRSRIMNFAEFTVAVPPNHVAGRIELPQAVPDPSRDFVVMDQAILSKAAFTARIAPSRRGKRGVGVFVHGYNYNFQESLFRMAQMVADSGQDLTPVLFAWPSEASATGYVADKDSAAYSRDDLAELLTVLASDPKIDRVMLAAHSMGASIAMESLRQLRLAGKHSVIKRLDVVLASPDIDVDLFRKQAEVIGPLKPPIALLVAKDDRALSLASRIAGERGRAGAFDVNDPRVQEVALRSGIRVVDISDVTPSNRFNHDRFVHFAALYPRVVQRSPYGDLQRAGAYVFRTGGVDGGSVIQVGQAGGQAAHLHAPD
jgi:esterase/lipase superfamily enzyme